ncbi:MAG: porin [Pseudomonadota bacterium]
MTTAKRLLLGTAAAFVATSGAHAADLGLPVAPAVDYVQICTIGGFTGFVLPGGDVCFDISGFARFQADIGVDREDVGFNTDSDDDDIDFASEVEIDLDARTMTELGLLRGFIRLGASGEPEDYGLNVNKAFVQINGLTAGLTDSFFDPVYTDYAMAGLGAADGGTDDLALIGYSFNAGNGIIIMASIEDNGGNGRFAGIADVTVGLTGTPTQGLLVRGDGGVDLNGNFPGPGVANSGTVVAGEHAFLPGGTIGDRQDTDNGLALVGATQITQAWGTAKVAGAIVQVDEDGTNAIDSEIGYALQASAEFNLPFGVSSVFGIFGIYTEGALSYTGLGGATLGFPATALPVVSGGLPAATIDISYDALIDGAGNLQLTEAFALGAGFEFGLNAMTDLELDAYYADVDHFGLGGLGDYQVFGIRGSVAYRPVSGLELRAGVGYTSFDVANGLDPFIDDGITGRFRITRSF